MLLQIPLINVLVLRRVERMNNWADYVRQEHFDASNTSELGWLWWSSGEPMEEYYELLKFVMVEGYKYGDNGD